MSSTGLGPQDRAVVSEMVLITPEIAREWRDTKHFERQRDLSEDNIVRLAHEMSKKRFVQGTQIYLCVLPDGSELIINGNHTLEAVVSCGMPQLLTVTRCPVVSIDEAGFIYSVFDKHRRRTLRESMKAAGAGNGKDFPRYFGSAVACIMQGFRLGGSAKAIPHVDIIERLDEYTGAVEEFEGLTASCSKECMNFLRRAPVLAVCLETLRHQPGAAQEFWSLVAKDTGLREGMPAHTLLRYFRNTANSQNRVHQARASAMAWNGFYKRTEVFHLKVEGARKITIMGTPHEQGVRVYHGTAVPMLMSGVSQAV